MLGWHRIATAPRSGSDDSSASSPPDGLQNLPKLAYPSGLSRTRNDARAARRIRLLRMYRLRLRAACRVAVGFAEVLPEPLLLTEAEGRIQSLQQRVGTAWSGASVRSAEGLVRLSNDSCIARFHPARPSTANQDSRHRRGYRFLSRVV